nr:synaptobrevin, longin-like domain protein [Tanacetum cinerariifolium]
KSINYVPVDAGTNSTNFSGTKVTANQEVKKDVSSLRYIVLSNWVHDALLESSSSKPHVKSSTQVPKGSGNLNPTVSSSNPPADQMETLTVESSIPTVSSPVPTACLNDSPEPSSEARLILKRVANQKETPSLDNILSLTNRIEKIDEGTHILATVDGISRTVSESSLRRNLKLRDEDGIVSIPDTELFKNLTLMGYNISQNQKLTFQKGQFSHQWKYLIHTIMQGLSPKSIGFNEFSSNIATALVCLATNRTYNFSKMIFNGMVKNINNKTSKFLMYP